MVNHRRPAGTLFTDDVLRETVKPVKKKRQKKKHEVAATMVRPPFESNMSDVMTNAANMCHNTKVVRSLEMWWEKKKEHLAVVMATTGGADDLTSYKQDMLTAYPDATYIDLGEGEENDTESAAATTTNPAWLQTSDDLVVDDPKQKFVFWDTGLMHGHLQTCWDSGTSYDLASVIGATIQESDRAWVQLVFCSPPAIIPKLQAMSGRLQSMNKTVTNTAWKPFLDSLLGWGNPRDHPEKGKDFENNYPTLEDHLQNKMRGAALSMASLRCVMSVHPTAEMNFSGVAAQGFDHLVQNTYAKLKLGKNRDGDDGEKRNEATAERRRRIFELFRGRLLPPVKILSKYTKQYTGKRWCGLGGYYTPRQSPPFLLFTGPEAGLFLRLPDPNKVKNTSAARVQKVPIVAAPIKKGFVLGFADPVGELPDNFFGEIVTAADRYPDKAGGVVLAPPDLRTHMYIVGGTNSGKTTLIRCIAKHLEMANLPTAPEPFPNAFIFVDPKGSDSYDFLRQCDPRTYERGQITYLDPIETGFSLNLFELPPYNTPDEREVLVLQYVGYITQMIEYWFTDSDSFVRLKRILAVLLQYVYLQNDKPTFLDIYEIVVKMQAEGKEMLVSMWSEMGEPSDGLKPALESIAGMEKQAYEPVLNRLEKFATNPILRRTFCASESTVDFEKLIEAGSYTVIRISELNIPRNVITLIKQTLCIKLWFVIQKRVDQIKDESKRTQVLLALDEFQDVAELPIIESILTQARSYGLGLLLAHQTSTQLNSDLFEIITGNAGLQFVGHVAGKDGARFGDVWDPSRSKEIKEQLTIQEYRHWTARPLGAANEAQPTPVQFWPVLTPQDCTSEESVQEFIVQQRERHGAGVVVETMIAKASTQDKKWRNQIPAAIGVVPDVMVWRIMLALNTGALFQKAIVKQYRPRIDNRDRIAERLEEMVKEGLLHKRKTLYMLTDETREKYFQQNTSEYGESYDIPHVHRHIKRYYVHERQWFFCVAGQTPKKDVPRTDLVVFDYENNMPVSVEVESAAEIDSHPEHVICNMTKWRDMGFGRCDVWSTSPKLQEVYDELDENEREGVTIHLVPYKDSERKRDKARWQKAREEKEREEKEKQEQENKA